MDVHKVPLQFQEFLTKAIDEISSSDLFCVLSGYQSFHHIAFQVVLLMNKTLLNESLIKWLLFKIQCVLWFIETKSDQQTQRNFRAKYERDP